MDKNILKIILGQKEKYVPLIFTEKQFKVLKKYHNGNKLSNADKKALYTSITKKMKALESIKVERDKEYYILGYDKIISGRIREAKKILAEYKDKRVFISGSFLFSKKYNDIDIFVIKERGYKEEWEGNQHLISLTEKRLERPVFQSAALISISNFPLPSKIKERPLKLGEFMSSYHEAGIEIMSKQEREITRYIVFTYYLKIKKTLLNGLELGNITRKLTLDQLDDMVRAVLIRFFSKKYLYVAIHPYVKTLSEFIKSEKNTGHLKRYKSLYEEIIYESRRSKAASA
ncbi:MAG: hypothetical protein KAT77_01070 [Nanoarchaeota archaeon]|nr:hypothetical protein [Nanoarchaeota archaeon]